MPDGWVDIHAHILPALDDGAQTLEQALEMARMAQAGGVECIVATPHYSVCPLVLESSVILQETERLRGAMQEAGLSITLLPGAEVQIDPDICDEIARGEAITLAGSRYMLLELPPGEYPLYTDEIIFRIQVLGLSVILAHPERNQRIQDHPDVLIPLIERGVLTQLTAASITGMFGSRVRSVAEYLLRSNMAHIIASDAHGGRYRRPILSDAVAAAGEIVGRARAEAMASAIPRAIVRDEIVTATPPRPAGEKKAKGFWQRLRG
jgi:protein-tyrosine phosphatase